MNVPLALMSLVGKKNSFSEENLFRLNWLAIDDAEKREITAW